MSIENKERNYGIDIIRIVSMIMVCILHTLNQGGVLVNCDQNGIINWEQYYMCWFLEALTIGAVTLFALISGYVGYESKFKISRVISLWIQVAFYTILITVLFRIFRGELVTSKTWIQAFSPIYHSEYWYMSAYFPLLFLMPIINSGIKNTSNKILYIILGFILISASCVSFIIDKGNSLGLGYGYSFIWLTLMYIVGAIIKKTNIDKYIPWYAGILLYIVCTTIGYLIFRFKNNSIYINYNSPTTVFGVLGLFISCLKIKINNNILRKIIKLFAEASLGVYLIHVNQLIWVNYMKSYAVFITNDPSVILLLLKILGVGLLLYVSCAVVDMIRIFIFKIIRLKKLLSKLDNLVKE